MEKIVAKAPMMSMRRPSSQPLFEKANGRDSAPAPSVAEHKLKTLPRTEPSRNQDAKASRGSAAEMAPHMGVPGEKSGDIGPDGGYSVEPVSASKLGRLFLVFRYNLNVYCVEDEKDKKRQRERSKERKEKV